MVDKRLDHIILGLEKSKVLTYREKIKRGGMGQGVAADAWRKHDLLSKSQVAVTWAVWEKSNEWLYRHVVS